MMNFLLQYLALSTGILMLVYFVYVSFFRKDTYHNWNRHFLLSSSILSVILPIAIIYLNSLSIAQNLPEFVLAETIVTEAAKAKDVYASNQYLPIILLCIYLMGFLLGVYRFLAQLQFISQLRKDANQQDWKDVKVMIHQREIAPFSFYKAIYINEDQYQTHRNTLLVHERIHIKERHTIDILLLQIFQIIFWFNPFYYLYKKELKSLHEYICDAKAITQIPESEYRIALLSCRLAEAGITINHSFNQFNLKRRLSVMNKQKSGWLTLKAFLMIPILSLGIILMSAMLPNQFILDNSLLGHFAIEETASTLPVQLNTEAINPQEEPDIVQPTFPGGQEALLSYISQTIKYPMLAAEAGIAGTVYVGYVVKKSGEVSKVELKRGLSITHDGARAIEAEAIRVIESMPNWTPGTKNGKPVSIQMTIPIKFNLD